MNEGLAPAGSSVAVGRFPGCAGDNPLLWRVADRTFAAIEPRVWINRTANDWTPGPKDKSHGSHSHRRRPAAQRYHSDFRRQERCAAADDREPADRRAVGA